MILISSDSSSLLVFERNLFLLRGRFPRLPILQLFQLL
jgi:hypothetical protein